MTGATEIRDDDGNLMAIVVTPGDMFLGEKEGIAFVTPHDLSLQLGVMKRARDHHVVAHYHEPQLRSVAYSYEVLVVMHGLIEVRLYGAYEAARIKLRDGQAIMLFAGHSVTMLEDSLILEVKQGPYLNDKKPLKET
jgi:hypothetical protein